MSGNGSNFCNSTTFTSSGWYSVATGNYFVEYLGNSQNVSHTFQTNTAIMYGGGCGACPGPTPSVTITPSITPTPSVTVTPSPTPIVIYEYCLGYDASDCCDAEADYTTICNL